jgi:hypothetical protein
MAKVERGEIVRKGYERRFESGFARYTEGEMDRVRDFSDRFQKGRSP